METIRTMAENLFEWQIKHGWHQRKVAKMIYNYRCDIGIESRTNDDEEKRIKCIKQNYGNWIRKGPDRTAINNDFSLYNLYILKQLMHCDYEYLLGDIPTPHLITPKLCECSGLSPQTIERLLSISETYNIFNGTESRQALCAKYTLYAFKILLQDPVLLFDITVYLNSDSYLSNITRSQEIEYSALDACFDDPSHLNYFEGKIHRKDIEDIYLSIIISRLQQLREKNYVPVTPQYKNAWALTDDPGLDIDIQGMYARLKRRGEELGINIYNEIASHKLYGVLNRKHDNSSDLKNNAYNFFKRLKSFTTSTKDPSISLTYLRMLRDIFKLDYVELIQGVHAKKVDDNLKQLQHETIEECLFDLVPLLSSNPIFTSHPEVPPQDVINAIEALVQSKDFLTCMAYYLYDLPFTSPPDTHIPLGFLSTMAPGYTSGDDYLSGDKYNSIIFQASLKHELESLRSHHTDR